MGNISFWQLIVIAIIIAILFGTKKLRNLGSDLGASIKGFKKEMNNFYDDFDDKEKNKKTSKNKNSLSCEKKNNN